MPAVQRRDGQNIHEGQDDAKKGRHVPELVPVPRGGEDASDGAEASQLLGSLLGEQILHLVDVAGQGVDAQLYTGGDGGEERVFLLHHGQEAVGLHPRQSDGPRRVVRRAVR